MKDNGEYLEIVECTIENIEESKSLIDKAKHASIKYRKLLMCKVPLYKKDLTLLKKMLGCKEDKDIIGKKLVLVNKDLFARAIGYQGTYFILYLRDNSSKLLSEMELCQYLDCFNIVKYKDDYNPIDSYTVISLNSTEENSEGKRRKM